MPHWAPAAEVSAQSQSAQSCRTTSEIREPSMTRAQNARRSAHIRGRRATRAERSRSGVSRVGEEWEAYARRRASVSRRTRTRSGGVVPRGTRTRAGPLSRSGEMRYGQRHRQPTGRARIDALIWPKLPPGVTSRSSGSASQDSAPSCQATDRSRPTAHRPAPSARYRARSRSKRRRSPARLTALAVIADLKSAIGDLDRIAGWATVTGSVNTDPGYPHTTRPRRSS
jgi:hypothetical protein